MVSCTIDAPAIITGGGFVVFIFLSAVRGSVRFGREGTDPQISAEVCPMMEF